MLKSHISNILAKGLVDHLFEPSRQLIPGINEFYELELAFYESQILDEANLIRNSAYFARIGETFTRHFLMCTGEPLRLPTHSSSRLRSFFEKNIFRTGYATHGLFPYRGKFHPQMVKGLINTMGIKPGEVVLDPMMGSGTVSVEACLMGIHSVGIDASPFCKFMAQTKYDALTMSLVPIRNALASYKDVFARFQQEVGAVGSRRNSGSTTNSRGFMAAKEAFADYVTRGDHSQQKEKAKETLETYNFLLLAYLDAAGYAERSERKSQLEQFKAILERYLFVAEKIQRVLNGARDELGHVTLQRGDARKLSLEDASVDGILFSPPYSFAIDYLENDAFHLSYMGVDKSELQDTMVGLRGKNLQEKFTLYREDMGRVLSECARVLRRERICTIIVGTNSNQLGRVMGMPPEDVPGLHQMLTETAAAYGLFLVRVITRSIFGISNTMRREHILLLEKRP